MGYYGLIRSHRCRCTRVESILFDSESFLEQFTVVHHFLQQIAGPCRYLRYLVYENAYDRGTEEETKQKYEHSALVQPQHPWPALFCQRHSYG